MEWIILGGIAYWFVLKAEQNKKEKQKQGEGKHLKPPESIQDLEENEKTRFNPDTKEEDLKRFKISLGDHQFKFGPDPELANDWFYEWGKNNLRPVPIESPDGYLI